MLLKGIKVLDLSNLLPGPMCSLFLADLGADVIKVENLRGDLMRSVDPNKSKSPYFAALNRNKKSIALNLKTSEGKLIFTKLAKNADVIIESFRPGKLHSLGLGYEDIKKANPKIIYCSITGYGQKGPNKNKAGHDLNYSALSGLLDVLSDKPFVPGAQIADVCCAIIAAFSIVSSLFYTGKSGKGNYIDASIFNSALSLISIHIAQHSLSGNRKTILAGSKPCYNVYKTKDNIYASLGAVEGKFWQSFCNATKRHDLLSKQFESSAIKEMKMLFKSRTMAEWMKLNKKYDFCCEPVKKIEEVINDEYLNNGGAIIMLEGIKQVALPVAFSAFAALNYSRSPNLGEDTKGILSGMGYNKKAINELRGKGVIL
ncbi:CoA transferase [Candidatus Woesearchaeota archaeon]|nr:CoA transferase [Candidatus Woesearchaeota archaeon]